MIGTKIRIEQLLTNENQQVRDFAICFLSSKIKEEFSYLELKNFYPENISLTFYKKWFRIEVHFIFPWISCSFFNDRGFYFTLSGYVRTFNFIKTTSKDLIFLMEKIYQNYIEELL